MNCYFCNDKLNISEPDVFSSHVCKKCSNLPGIHEVITTVNVKEDPGLLYAHIFVRSPDYQILSAKFETESEEFSYTRTKKTTFTGAVQIGKNYQVRLHLKDNQTHIISHYHEAGIATSKEVKVLEGFSINPHNVVEKLETILLFL